MSRKARMKVLERIAQSAGTTGTTGTTGTGTTGTTTTSTTTTPTNPPPPPSPAATVLFPSLTIGWDSSRVPYINRIIMKLDSAVGIGTNGKYTFKILWDSKFPAGAESEFTSPVKDCLSLLRKAFVNFLNNGVVFRQQLNTGQIIQRINALLNAPELTKLEQVNQAGPLGKAGVSLPSIRQDLMSMMPTAQAR